MNYTKKLTDIVTKYRNNKETPKDIKVRFDTFLNDEETEGLYEVHFEKIGYSLNAVAVNMGKNKTDIDQEKTNNFNQIILENLDEQDTQNIQKEMEKI